MSYSVSDIKSDLAGVLHGTTVNKVVGLDQLINRAARQFLLEVDAQETRRLVPLALPINNNQFEYPCPSDLKGNKVIDVRPQVNRNLGSVFLQTYSQDFDISKLNTFQPQFEVNFNTAVKSLRVNAPFLNTNIIVNTAANITDNGTWAVGGSASNLENNTQNFVYNTGSLQFALDAGADPSAGYIENSTMDTINLVDHYLQSIIYFWVYLPTAANFTSVQIRWGSSSADYWSKTLTTNSQSVEFQNGWNLLAAEWSNATVTGSPDSENVNYIRVTYNYDGTEMEGVLLNQIVSMKGYIYNVEYYSKCLFRTTSGTFIEKVASDTDLINLETETYDIFFNQVAYLCVQQLFDAESGFDANFFKARYDEGVTRYKAMYKSQLQKPTTNYYTPTNNSYKQYWGPLVY